MLHILTKDEKYIIMQHGYFDNIFVLNVETLQIKQCKIKCVKGENIAFIPSKPSFKVNLLIYRFIHIYIKEIASNHFMAK